MSSDDTPPPEPILDAILVPQGELRPGAPPADGRPFPPGRVSPWPRVVRPPHPGFWFALLWCIGFLFVTQVPGVIVAVVILVGTMVGNPAVLKPGQDPAEVQAVLMKTPAWSLALAAAMLTTEILVVGVSWLVIRLVVGRQWPRQLALRRPGVVHLVLVLAACPAMILLANGFYLFLKHVVHLKGFSDWGLGGMEEMGKVFAHWPTAFGVLVIGLGPGIGEELWCRGFLGRGLVGRYGALGVVATSFFFGFIHLDPPQATYAMLVGVWLHFVYLTTRSLWMPMLLHFLNNSLSIIGTHVEALQAIDEGDIPLYVFAGAAVLLTAIGYALYQSRARLAPVVGDGPPPWKPPYPGVEYPPPGSGTRVVYPLPSLAASLIAFAGFAVFLACCLVAGFYG